jgi:hypothetical protein
MAGGRGRDTDGGTDMDTARLEEDNRATASKTGCQRAHIRIWLQRRGRCAKLCIVANFSATAVARHLVAEALTDVVGPRVAQRSFLGRALSDVTLGGVAAVRVVPAITGAVVPGVGAIS